MPVDDASTAAHSRPARAQLVLAFSNVGHARFELPREGTLIVGRGRDAQLRLDDASISRQHAALHLGAGLEVEDLGSANGTRLDGRALAPHRREPLPLGSIVEVGAFRLLARAAAPATGPDDAMARVREVVRRVAPSDLPIIVTGETGAGKEILAQRIHEESLRARGPLLVLNCAALPEGLLDSELFGYEKGAFTGADQAKPGLLESANGGTVLLDEIGEMSPATQAKMLRVLESREVMRIGGRRPTPIDVRFIVATHKDLSVLVVMGGFREDLLFRLNGITIRLPPLRERPSDLLPIARELLAAAAARATRRPLALSDDAALLLQSYRWPGNVRELRQVLDRAALLCPNDVLGVEYLVFGTTGADPAPPESRSPLVSSPRPAPREAPLAVVDPERARIEKALEQTGGNQTEAAKLLGISRRTLSDRLDAHGVTRPRKGGRKPEP